MKIHDDLTELVGNTPLLRLRSLGVEARIVGKLEYLNPGGSAKDRVAVRLLDARRRSGSVGSRLLEKSGANTAVSLAWTAARGGLEATLVLPDDAGRTPVALCRLLGAEVRLVPPGQVAAEWTALAAESPDAYRPDQFASPENVLAHRTTTGPEIWRDTDGQVDAVVAGIGTGGTLAGLSRFLKPLRPGCAVVGVEPEEAPVFSLGRHGAHGIPGLGLPARPVLLREDDLDEVILVSTGDAVRMTRRLAREEGVLAGTSSGAAVEAAVRYAARPENAGKLIVVILADGAARYAGSEEGEVR